MFLLACAKPRDVQERGAFFAVHASSVPPPTFGFIPTSARFA